MSIRPLARGPTLSAAEARRVALAAQGFADPRPARADARAIARVLRRTSLLQIDSVNVLARAQYLPVFSRAGPYPTATLDRASTRPPRSLFEYWGHEACLLPVGLHPLLRWRMARVHEDAWGGMRRLASEQPGLLTTVLDAVNTHGPVTAAALERALGRPRDERRDGWGWRWSEVKQAVEYLFWSGEITSARRGAGFERWYDLPSRVLPAASLDAPTPDPADAHRGLVRLAARAHGVASVQCLRDYFRQPVDATRRAVAELVADGELVPARVDGWHRPAYLHRDARLPRTVSAQALLAPFDPLIFERQRTQSLFGFRYRVEIYVPAAQRVHGYYVLPFLLDEALVARVDLKADRSASVLRVQNVTTEPAAPAHTVPALAAELENLAGWLGLSGVAVAGRGDVAPALAAALA